MMVTGVGGGHFLIQRPFRSAKCRSRANMAAAQSCSLTRCATVIRVDQIDEYFDP
jgi:hypothetical protein